MESVGSITPNVIITLDSERVLYGQHEEADQFMLCRVGEEDVFFINTTLDEVLSELGMKNEN